MGFFKLFRNLRDGSRADILSEPHVLRVWIHILCETRAFEDEAAELRPGEVLIKRRATAEMLGMPQVQFEKALNRILERGSVRLTNNHLEKAAVVNWLLYQKHVYPAKEG